MQIQINTDHNIEGHEGFMTRVTAIVENALSRFSEHITQVNIHLSDENSDKKGGQDDMRCMMEARLEGHHAIAVTQESTTLDEAIEGAIDKLSNLIESTLERKHDKELRRADPPGRNSDLSIFNKQSKT